MFWYHWIALVSLGICLVTSSGFFIRILRLGKPIDYSTPAGNIAPGVRYSFTGGMNPLKKESAYLHLPTYIAGIFYHLGTFLSIALFFLFLTGVLVPEMITLVLILFLITSFACGTGILIKRIVNKGLRDLSDPDDYISNLLVTCFQFMTGMVLITGSPGPFYFILSGILFLWIPFGKLKHAIYFFAARYHLGFFYGWRGTWPPKKMERNGGWKD